jgi:hypothetical protein
MGPALEKHIDDLRTSYRCVWVRNFDQEFRRHLTFPVLLELSNYPAQLFVRPPAGRPKPA